MLACSKLSLFEPTLWASTLAALLQQPESINSQDASSAAYALATAAVANGGSVRGVGRQQVTDALLTLTSKVHSFAVDSSSSSSSNSSSSRGKGGASVAAQAISNLLWSLARLEVQPPLHELEGLLQGLADPRVLASASPLAIVNSLWALSELQHLSSWGRNSDTAAAGVVRGNLGSMQAASNGTGKGSKQQQQQQQLLRIIPAVLLSEQQLVLLAKSSSQGVSNAVLALSRCVQAAVFGKLAKLWRIPLCTTDKQRQMPASTLLLTAQHWATFCACLQVCDGAPTSLVGGACRSVLHTAAARGRHCWQVAGKVERAGRGERGVCSSTGGCVFGLAGWRRAGQQS
jgi:hypothetical protein